MEKLNDHTFISIPVAVIFNGAFLGSVKILVFDFLELHHFAEVALVDALEILEIKRG